MHNKNLMRIGSDLVLLFDWLVLEACCNAYHAACTQTGNTATLFAQLAWLVCFDLFGSGFELGLGL